ncbi:hypothetical protein FRC17_003464 [Serendipita sp. 399]|nr:hypothetical protein FRC17_003464 [Serendipita sp. 399]
MQAYNRVTHLSAVDTIRVRIQTYPSDRPIPRSLNGLVGSSPLSKLYAGLPIALGFSIPALAVYLTTYDAAKYGISNILLGRDPDLRTVPWLKQVPIYLASGLTAEMVSGVIWTPMDVAKSRLQRGGEGHTTARSLLKDIWKKEGYRGVWRPSDWALYETFKKAVIPNYNPYRSTAQAKGDGATEVELATRYAASSAIAMSLSAIVTNPIEVVRTRWQTSGGDVNRPASMIALVREMWRQAGWKAFMRGAAVRGIYYIPSNVGTRGPEIFGGRG